MADWYHGDQGRRPQRNAPLLWWAGGGSCLLLLGLIALACKPRYPEVHSFETRFFRSRVVVYLAAGTPEKRETASALAITEIRRLEEAFNPLNPGGSLYALNQQRLSTDQELYALLHRAIEVSDLTGGAFNIFTANLEQAYGFHKQVPQPPAARLIREILLAMSRANLRFDPERSQLRMTNDAYGVSLTGIREGYTADQALAHLSYVGIRNARVQVGNQVACSASPDGLGWLIEVPPQQGEQSSIRLRVEDRGVASVTDDDDAYTYRGETYYNHLDPTTGRPARLLRAVTVVAATCEFARELASGIFIMAPANGLQTLNSLPGVEGVLLDRAGNVFMSDSLFVWLDR